MANRRITEFPPINGADIDEQDLLTLVHVFEVDPALRNKKITFTEFKNYLDQYYAAISGETFNGNVTINALLTSSGVLVQNDLTVSGTVSGSTITGATIQGTNATFNNISASSYDVQGGLTVSGDFLVLGSGTFNSGIVVSGVVSGGSIDATSGIFTSISGASITGVSGVFTNQLSGATITGESLLANTLTGVTGVFTSTISGETVTGTTASFTSGVFANLVAVNQSFLDLTVARDLIVSGSGSFVSGLSVTGTISGVTVTGASGSFENVQAISGIFTNEISGTIITGSTGKFTNISGASGVFTSYLSGNTITGERGEFVTGVFTHVDSDTISCNEIVSTTGSFTVVTGNSVSGTFITGVTGTFTSSLSGATITGDTIDATVITGQTGTFTSSLSGATITGNTVNATAITGQTGTFTSSLSGATITGDTIDATVITGQTGTFTSSLSGATITGDTINVTVITGETGIFTSSLSGATITGNTVNATAITGETGIFTSSLSGATITGNTVNTTAITGQTGTYTSSLSGATITGDTINVTAITGQTGTFTSSLSGATITGDVINATVITGQTGVYTSSLSGATVTGNAISATNITGNAIVFTSSLSGETAVVNGISATWITGGNISGGTITGTLGRFITATGLNSRFTFVTGVTGTFTSSLSGATITGDTINATVITGGTGTFTSSLSGASITGDTINATVITGVTITATTGIFASGTEAAPSVVVGDNNTGFYSQTANGIAISTNGSGRVYITNNGKVGINYSTPDESLVALGIVRAIGPSGGHMQITHDSVNGAFRNSQGAFLIYAEGANPCIFHTDNAERFRLTSDGKSEFTSTQNVNAMLVNSTNASFTNSCLTLRATKAAATDYYFLIAASDAGSDNEFLLRGDGNAFADGTWSGGGADYAEYFEWSDGNPDREDRRGISVVLEGNKIRPAVAGEDPIGVVSGNPSVVGDAAWNKWSSKYLRDEYGAYLKEDYEIKDENGNIVIQQRRKLNPAFDPDLEYIPREKRPEWDCIGLMGKLVIRKGQPIGGRWIKMHDVNDFVEQWLVR